MSGDSISGRRDTDYSLLQVLDEYVKQDNCHPKFAKYFREYITANWPDPSPPGAPEGSEEYEKWVNEWNDFFAYCGRILRNPELTKYNFGSSVLRQIEKYDIYDDWFPEEGFGPTGKEFDPIPEEYRIGSSRPGTSATTSYMTPSTHGSQANRGSRRLEPKQSVGSSDSNAETTPINLVPPSAMSSGPSGEAPASKPITMDTTGANSTIKSYDQYGKQQQPLATHLQAMVAYLENGESHDAGFSERMSDTIDYLQWLGSGKDARNQLHNASEFTKAVYKKAIELIDAHLKRDKQRRIATPVAFTERPVSFAATRSSRLNHLTNPRDFPLPSKRGVPDHSQLLPYNITPAPEKRPIQGALLEHPEHYAQFLEDEGKLWLPYSEDLEKLNDMEIPTSVTADELENNLAVIESDIYVQYTKAQGNSATWETGDPIGWTTHRTDEAGVRHTYISTGEDPKTGKETLNLMDLSDPKDWASVRGVRRAGLQLMLRNLRTNENDFVYYDSDSNGQRARRLVLPIPVATIRKVMERANGKQWNPPTLFDEKPLVWSHWEPFRFTDRFQAYTEATKGMKAVAYQTATERHLRDRSWVSLPKNVKTGGPFVWRGLSPQEQAEEDLLKRCLAIRGYVAMCWNRAPRPLLANMIQFLTAGDPSSDAFPEPEELGKIGEITFGESDYRHTVIDGTRQRAGIRFIDEEDIWWLKVLGSGCVNKKSWPGKIFPDEPRETYRLFRIFAKRILRLLEDPNPEGILYSSASVVTVEDLLKVINAGANGKAAVNKHEFSPYEACQHLDRLAQTGHIDFELDPACYGTVRRPAYDFYPEHRIVYDAAEKKRDTLFPRSIRPWADVCLEPYSGKTKSPPRVLYAVDNFYRSLAYRLGFTIFHLQKKSAARKKSHMSVRNEQPVQYAWLHDAIKKFNAVYDETVEEELRARPNPPAPYGHTWRDIKALVQDTEFGEGGHTNPASHPIIPHRGYLKDNASAIQHLRNKIIQEVSANNTLLAPARAKTVINLSTGLPEVILTRGVSWKFGSLVARQENFRRQFFSLNRWPLVLQSEKTQEKIKNDEWHADGVDPKQVFDHQAADPIHAFFSREKLRPYVEDPVKYRAGPAVFPVGDTAWQRKRVEEHMTALVYESIGLNGAVPRGGTFREKLKDFFFREPLRPYLNGAEKLTESQLEARYGKLPDVPPNRVPRSWATEVLVGEKVENRKRKVDEILEAKKQEEEARNLARYKRRRVDDQVAGTRMTGGVY
ncbi:uncharacterized protein PODANS_1_2470 [Podospora anserina S mat+]|uniref:Podospora anserina S mat+ genomic DNA chromosome 1, supercontig 1 n=1 Tax=Podospora anserina (strain S / ATCC MYA-4624 / DSM 980 / FGSC 10383) TaxID=515849 RepID=B2AA12_PODAN|nr:uncharacterized protein PODANS_1_2470 [Podospora anserina S mat+]CAP59923.1 unnamed protein product [Podospora anserina S mat+]CDP22565.1 Putative protein of unknown function [Podospora anserina S mat+]